MSERSGAALVSPHAVTQLLTGSGCTRAASGGSAGVKEGFVVFADPYAPDLIYVEWRPGRDELVGAETVERRVREAGSVLEAAGLEVEVLPWYVLVRTASRAKAATTAN